jgi:hypothetical protein
MDDPLTDKNIPFVIQDELNNYTSAAASDPDNNMIPMNPDDLPPGVPKGRFRPLGLPPTLPRSNSGSRKISPVDTVDPVQIPDSLLYANNHNGSVNLHTCPGSNGEPRITCSESSSVPTSPPQDSPGMMDGTGNDSNANRPQYQSLVVRNSGGSDVSARFIPISSPDDIQCTNANTNSDGTVDEVVAVDPSVPSANTNNIVRHSLISSQAGPGTTATSKDKDKSVEYCNSPEVSAILECHSPEPALLLDGEIKVKATVEAIAVRPILAAQTLNLSSSSAVMNNDDMKK